MEILLLSGDGDGIEELASKLAGMTNIDGLHLFTHGSEGRIHLGDDALSSESLADHTEALALIRGSLSEKGDLLVYGCNVGASAQGQQFVEDLAIATGADVAASDDVTGNLNQGGDWVLETASGLLEATPLAASLFSNTLAQISIQQADVANLTATDLVDALIPDGAGITFSNASIVSTGSNTNNLAMAGTFSGGNAAGLDELDMFGYNRIMDRGIVLSTGIVGDFSKLYSNQADTDHSPNRR